jgi:hypothetical protein
MKKLIFYTSFTLFAILFTGCSSLLLTANSVAKKVYIGMPVDEFKKLAGVRAEIEAITLDYTVYRIDEWAGPTDDRYVNGAKFFHFDSNGRLFQVDSRDFNASHSHGHHHGRGEGRGEGSR